MLIESRSRFARRELTQACIDVEGIVALQTRVLLII